MRVYRVLVVHACPTCVAEWPNRLRAYGRRTTTFRRMPCANDYAGHVKTYEIEAANPTEAEDAAVLHYKMDVPVGQGDYWHGMSETAPIAFCEGEKES